MRPRHVIVTDERVAAFVAARIKTEIFAPFVGIGLEKDGRIVAGCIFNCYTGPDIQATVAAEPGAVTLGFVRALGRYVFEIAKCERVSFETEQPKVGALAIRLGARPEGCKSHAFGRGRHAILYGILKENWKF